MNAAQAIKNYTSFPITPLCFMFDEIGSDKGVGWHQYSRFYNQLFSVIKKNPINLFEMGLGTNDPTITSTMGIDGNPGASHYIWKLFFRNANIYGADIDRKILFEESRLKTFYCDQLNVKDIHAMWTSDELCAKSFMIIIDDGLHTFDAGVTFFENSIHKLLDGGVYIIEDIHEDYLIQWRQQLALWEDKYTNSQFWLFRIESLQHNPIDNWILVCQKGTPLL
jgi:hypothetical protein